MKKLKFVIVSPRQRGGGPIVMHALCKYLVKLGHKARIFYIGPYDYRKGKKFKFYKDLIRYNFDEMVLGIKKLFTSKEKALKDDKFTGYVNLTIKGCKRKLLPCVSKNTIVIYPESVYGNFLKAKNVVRWFLYHNRYAGDSNAFGENDLFVTYRDVFNDENLNPKNNKLYMAYYNLDLYKRTNYGERSGKCYIIRKGKDRPDLPSEFDGVVIDDLAEAQKVKVFNECETCISYDTQSAYSSIAAICGCLSIVVPEKGKSRADYEKGDDKNFGIAFGFSEKEIDYAKKTQELALKSYEERNKSGELETQDFVKLCEEYFKLNNGKRKK